MLKSVKSHGCVSKSDPQLPPIRIDQQVLKTIGSHKVLGRRGGGGGVSQEIDAVDLAAICVDLLRSVLEYNVAWLDITPFLPICLVQ